MASVVQRLDMPRLAPWVAWLGMAGLLIVGLACTGSQDDAAPGTPTVEIDATESLPTGAPTSGLTVGTAAPATDKDVLIVFYEATDGANWSNNKNWLSEAPIDDWFGVTTDDGGRVKVLDLWADKLRGEIPAELGRLSKLEGLHLFANDLSGEIPAELGRLSNLKRLALGRGLYLGGSEVNEGIPAELASLSNLKLLYLEGNKLSGEIPAELGRLSNLEALTLGGRNQLTSCIPGALQNVQKNDLESLGLPFC